MRKYFILIAAAVLALTLAGCTQPADTGSTQPGAGSGAAPAAPAGLSAATVWTETLSTSAYQAWQTAPGFETTQPAKGPHGKTVQTFIDPNVVDTLGGPTLATWPTGSMIVKDAYDAAGALQSIEYMQKTDLGWFYASFGPDGTVSKEGVEVEPCKACHAKGSDAVRSFMLP
jgi:hypothetical protein